MKEITTIQMDYSDLKKILKEAQAEALKEASGHMYDKYSHVSFSIAEVCRLHSTCYRTISDMVKAGISRMKRESLMLPKSLIWIFRHLKKQR